MKAKQQGGKPPRRTRKRKILGPSVSAPPCTSHSGCSGASLIASTVVPQRAIPMIVYMAAHGLGLSFGPHNLQYAAVSSSLAYAAGLAFARSGLCTVSAYHLRHCRTAMSAGMLLANAVVHSEVQDRPFMGLGWGVAAALAVQTLPHKWLWWPHPKCHCGKEGKQKIADTWFAAALAMA